MESDFLSKREAAERLGVSVRTVQNWIKDGKFPNARQINKQWVIPENEVQTAVMYVDVVPVKRELAKEDLLNAFAMANQVLYNKIEEQNNKIDEQNESIKRLEKKLENFHDEMVTRWMREKQEQEQKKPLIKRLLGWK